MAANAQTRPTRRYTPAQAAERAQRTRYRVIGVILMALGMAGYVLFANGVDSSLVSTFGMNTGNTGAVTLDDWIVPTYSTVTLLSSIALFLGAFQFFRGFAKWTSAVLGFVILVFIFSFLVWATSDKSINLAALLKNSLLRSVPITLGALSGVLSERAGVVNIAIEGMMISGALVGVMVGSAAKQGLPPEQYGTLNLWIGTLGAVVAGLLLSLVHAVLSIRYKVDQIISGVVINIFAIGITSFISAKFLSEFPELNNSGIFPSTPIPVLSEIPFLGGILFDSNMFTYAMYILLIVVHVGLFYTRWGLRTRSVGEHPKAADTLGINVFRTRYVAVMLSGMMAGFAGAYFTLGSVGRFDELMTAGRGFIALAAMIFGKWTPFGAFGAALIFGFADSLQSRLAILRVPIPSEFLLMAPYIATMIALAGLIGRATPPAADGQPYEKE
jgi:simple sugar transport system permease protein